MRLLYGHSKTVAAFVASLIPGCSRGFGPCTAIGIIEEDGKLVAGIVYHNWSPETGVIEISGASITPRWLNKTVLKAMFNYPFIECECQMIVMRTSAMHDRLGRILPAYGFRGQRVRRLRGRDHDEMIYTLTDDDWRANKFMRKSNEQAESANAS